MSRPGDFDNMIGTDFALAQSLLSPPGALRLDDVLSECYQTFGADERDSECGPPFAVLKFACHSTTNPTQHGFIRMYIQIPYDRTLRSSREIRELQAEDNPVHKEYEALTTLSKSKCSKCMATPELLGYGQGRQGPEAYVPNGYITYVAWQRVPGSPLDSRFFWLEENRQYRDEVRAAFAVAYKELNKYGWQPAIRGPRKLIYDSFSKTM
ncbi:unnamed protein product [Penicillium salamii]|uniref:Uncharacterized protein n=1 Tax=Penicillium salamii TaxID=1612424 RepID=A0A9W4NX37_9EURO|nr:unnamed protein product [Penicillium salamii]CAG8194889.1 unnamed protein product [Penicillium salamii]CAG8307912.1 unnamed protein product [Penicillium salamii]CAG8360130.1 unnamed protein product [Penicillium salamii]CAG8406245.1 unnamed protein product [Penicillium salamii]